MTVQLTSYRPVLILQDIAGCTFVEKLSAGCQYEPYGHSSQMPCLDSVNLMGAQLSAQQWIDDYGDLSGLCCPMRLPEQFTQALMRVIKTRTARFFAGL